MNFFANAAAHRPCWLAAIACAGLTLAAPMIGPVVVLAGDAARFPSPEEAASTLAQAVQTTNRTELVRILGDAADTLVNPDAVQGDRELSRFAEAYAQRHQLAGETEDRRILEVGPDSWPFPVPIVREGTSWFFDTAAGLDELLNRRIGRNELEVLPVLRAYVEAQAEYAGRDWDGDGVLEFAQRIGSSSGKADGLYWSPEINGENSPLGPWVAAAQSEGYFPDPESAGDTPQPFHGYYFKILTRQGSHAPGGAHHYVIRGNMIAGFAMVAWPAEYGVSGIMTFIVNQQGRVYERDLGKRTGRMARRMSVYDPDPDHWRECTD